MVETVVAELGGLHIAVNNAGINKNSAAEDTTEQDWDLTFDLNTKGVFLCCQVCYTKLLVVDSALLRMQCHSCLVVANRDVMFHSSPFGNWKSICCSS